MFTLLKKQGRVKPRKSKTGGKNGRKRNGFDISKKHINPPSPNMINMVQTCKVRKRGGRSRYSNIHKGRPKINQKIGGGEGNHKCQIQRGNTQQCQKRAQKKNEREQAFDSDCKPKGNTSREFGKWGLN